MDNPNTSKKLKFPPMGNLHLKRCMSKLNTSCFETRPPDESRTLLFHPNRSPKPELPDITLPVSDYDNPEEDFRLKNWYNWMETRKKVFKNLSRNTGKDIPSLCINTSEDIRISEEEKRVFEFTEIVHPFDRYRGNPCFWRSPQFLKDDPCKPDLPKCAITPSRLQQNQRPKIEYVRVPDLIKEEKGIVGKCDKAHRDPWTSNQFRSNFIRRHSRKLQYLEPYRPKVDNMMIVGKGLLKDRNGPPSQPVCPLISVSDPSNHSSVEGSSLNELSPDSEEIPFQGVEDRPTVCLIIGDNTLRWRPSSSDDEVFDKMWTFSFSAQVHEIKEQVLRVENVGTMAVKYRWKKRIQTHNHETFPLTINLSPHFYFNENDGIFLPGQIVEIPVWFRARCCGIFQEDWELYTSPNVACPEQFLNISYWGVTYTNEITENLVRIEEYLNMRVKESAVREICQEVQERIRPEIPKEPPIRSLYLDEELFLLINPGYYFHPSVVAALRQLYANACSSLPQYWDLNINTLREKVLSQTDLTKREELFQELSKNVKILLQPRVEGDPKDEKYKQVYNILCDLANSVEEEAENLKKYYNLTWKTVEYPKSPKSSVRSVSRSSTETRKLKSPQRNNVSRRSNRSTKDVVSSVLGNAVDNISSVASENLRPDILQVTCYRESLYTKVYLHVGTAMERMAAALDSIKNNT